MEAANTKHFSLYADVAFPLSFQTLLTYGVPEHFVSRAAVGIRVICPLQNRLCMGYITGLSRDPQVSSDVHIKEIVTVVDDEPVIIPEVFDLCCWVSEYYCCSLGEALQAAAPPGGNITAKKRYMLNPHMAAVGHFSTNQKKVIEALYRRGVLDNTELAKITGIKNISEVLNLLLKRKVIQEISTTFQAAVSEKMELYACLIEENILDTEGQLELQRRAPRQAAVYFDLLHGEPTRLAPVLYEKHHVDVSVLRALERRKLIRLEYREVYRLPEFHGDTQAGIQPELTLEQTKVKEKILESLYAKTFQTFLLQGVTGSGKTEVYLQVVEEAITLGRNAIILVPEISLTPQTVARFKARFGTSIAVLHSGLGAGERYDEWRRARRGEVKIVVGARSAIFAPLTNIGVIVVDEEHDGSYKQTDPAPRYHARDVAIMRAKISDAVCILGSATPSLESFYNAQRGKFVYLELTKRVGTASLPQIRIVDLREETKAETGVPFLSRYLIDGIRERLDQNEQVLLLLNRRGFAPFVLCPLCGWIASCKDCQVSLTFHRKGGIVMCHYCNARLPVPQICSECGSGNLLFLGYGTQKVEETLLQMFPLARVERMDADTTSGKGGHAKILGRLASGEIDILVGTQMIAKGHDYPNVTLVGVLNADLGLGFPDFRAAEQTFQLLTQVAGRAGRGERPGEVIIQTYRPNHYAIRFAAKHEYNKFYEREMRDRSTTGYPPVRRMANVMFESEDPYVSEQNAGTALRIARQIKTEQEYKDVSILGPAPALIPRVRKKYKWHLAFLCPHAKRLNAFVRGFLKTLQDNEKTKWCEIKVDFDPYGFG